MAQNISLWGANYSNVPAVDLPKTGGGEARFADPSITTAVEADVASGKIFLKADGSQGTGTASGGGTPAISVVDTADSHGGYVRTITALDISDSTVTATDVLNSKWFYTADGTKTQGTATGGGGGATQHVIHLEFSDNTDTDINVYYDDSLMGTMITNYNPAGEWTYNNKVVVLAQLDNVTWYQYTPIPLNTQLVDYTSCVSGYCIDDDGSLHAQEWSWATDYTPILPNMTFSYRAYYWFHIGFYDESHTAISTLYVMNDATQDPNDTNTGYGTLDSTKIPVNAKYTRLCGTAANSNYISLIRTA